jgi:hypothetical protein
LYCVIRNEKKSPKPTPFFPPIFYRFSSKSASKLTKMSEKKLQIFKKNAALGQKKNFF